MKKDNRDKVNNDFYHELGLNWYQSQDDAIALLRREGEAKNPWVQSQIIKQFSSRPVRVLDIGCGGGFLCNYLAERGHKVIGVDQSASSLEIAKKFDSTQSVRYLEANASSIPLPDESFDVVCAMDFLEHVEDPDAVMKEASRLLRPGGLFIFHTFNRNPLSFIVVIKFMEWFIPGVPKNLHLYRLFIRPKEFQEMSEKVGLHIKLMCGLMPNFFTTSFISSILRRKLHPSFHFKILKSTLVSYLGVSTKRPRDQKSKWDVE